MKTPNEVIASDNSAAVNEMKESVVEVCDIMFNEFQKAVERSCKKFDRFVFATERIPNFSYDSDFESMVETHFRNMIGEWNKYAEIKIDQDLNSVPFGQWYFEITCKYDTMKNCFVEVDNNIPPKRQH